MDFISHQAERILACYTDSSLNSCVNKAEENDIEKAEGSKGGKVIGHTKSGKPIYATQNARHEKSFTSADHKDAAYAHLDLSTKLGKEGNKSTSGYHSSEYDRHMSTSQHKKRNEELDQEDLKIKKGDAEVEAATEHPNKLGAGAEKRKDLSPDDKFAAVMKEFKAGALHSGDGSIVTKRSQAIAVAMSESGKGVEKANIEDETED